jgi:multiple sugar transport system ATP-binding protein
MAEVILDSVTKVYAGGVKAVDSVSLAIRDREFIVLVGPSGCGKSTTLRMVAGLEEISAGTIRIGDRIVNDVPPKDRDIAMVFQNYALYPHMTVYKNMAFGLKLRGFPRKEIDERVRWAAQILGLADLLERKPKALSGGQRQRVAVGRAIVRHPKAFLFDEPLSNLDAKLRVETRAELKRLHKRLQTTTIYVTHDQEEAMTLGDRVVVMEGGVIQQCDAPLHIYNAPANRFVAGFLGTPPMNFLTGTLTTEGGTMIFAGAGLRLNLTPNQAQKLAVSGGGTSGGSGGSGGEVVLGIRPESLHLQSNGGGNGPLQPVSLNVAVVEPLGSSIDIHANTADGTDMVARVKADPQMVHAQTLTLYADVAGAHIFEPGPKGRNLTL